MTSKKERFWFIQNYTDKQSTSTYPKMQISQGASFFCNLMQQQETSCYV